MAQILISEPHPDLRVLLEAVVKRTGHDPIGSGELANGDMPAAMILEPGSAEGLAAAARLRGHFAELPIICTSIYPPPVVYLIKPYRLVELEAAIALALAPRGL
jgi:hypothetical protein